LRFTDQSSRGSFYVQRAKVDAILALKDAEGRISAESLVRAAADPDHPCHEDFEWDDGKAGHLFRMGQARTQIRTVMAIEVEVIVEHELPAMAATPYFIRDPDCDSNEPGYRAITEIRKDPESARTAAVRELSVAAAHLRRARNVVLSLGFGPEIDDLTAQVVGLRTRMETSAPEPEPARPS
jgi:hypothetical protein